jgi:chaperone required for assembly of F1-ATPase
MKTPAQNALSVPREKLARALAAEWAGQGDEIDIQGMHLTRLVNVAIDRTGTQRPGMIDEVVKYCETDLLCFLAETPTDLRERQVAAWRPVREWAGKALNILLMEVPDGLLAAPQPPASLDAARAYAEGLDDLHLTGLNFGLGLFGSASLAIAVCAGYISAPDAYERSILDEVFQAERWGQDDENLVRLTNNRAQAEALNQLFSNLL